MKTLFLVGAAVVVSMAGMTNAAHAATRIDATKKIERLVAQAPEGCTIQSLTNLNPETGEVETIQILVCDAEM